MSGKVKDCELLSEKLVRQAYKVLLSFPFLFLFFFLGKGELIFILSIAILKHEHAYVLFYIHITVF